MEDEGSLKPQRAFQFSGTKCTVLLLIGSLLHVLFHALQSQVDVEYLKLKRWLCEISESKSAGCTTPYHGTNVYAERWLECTGILCKCEWPTITVLKVQKCSFKLLIFDISVWSTMLKGHMPHSWHCSGMNVSFPPLMDNLFTNDHYQQTEVLFFWRLSKVSRLFSCKQEKLCHHIYDCSLQKCLFMSVDRKLF